MNAEQLISELRALDIQLSVDGERLRCSAPEGRLNKELQQRIQASKPELLRVLRSSAQAETAIPRRTTASGPLPLSFAQERFWFLQNFDPGSTAWNITAVLPFSDVVDPEALDWAWRAVVGRHEILRTCFPEERGFPVQVVAGEDFAPPIEIWDSMQLPPAERRAAAEARIAEAAHQPLDLQRGPLVRLALLRAGDQEQALLLTVHHILCDAWGIGILLSELKGFYAQRVEGSSWQPPPLQVQYGDYALWERERETKGLFRSQLEYWKEKLRDVPRHLELATDRPHTVSLPYEAKIQPVQLSAATSKLLKSCMAEAGTTPFMGLLAVYQALLHRYTKQSTVLVGTPVSTRVRPELEHLIGCLINTQALRCDFVAGMTTRQLLRQVRGTVIESLSYSDVPFETVLSEVVRERDLTRAPLVQTAFIQQNTPHSAEYRIVSGGSTLDLTFYIWETNGAFEGSIEYNGNLFDAPAMESLAACYVRLAEGMAGDPDAPIDSLPLLTGEQEALWSTYNHGPSLTIPAGGVHEWIERQATATPDAVAVVYGQQALTFREVSERSGRLANRLRALGVGPETLVALCLERSAELVISPLAVWKAGGAYVPIDPHFPASRVALMLENSGAAVMVTESALLDRLPADLPAVICLDRDRAALEAENSIVPSHGGSGDRLAYVLYTSGSTGIPKGVEITHASVMNFLLSMQREPGFRAADRLLAVTTFSFDIAGLELYLPLVSGGRVVIAPRESTLEGAALADLIRLAGITVMQATPVTWRMLLESGWKGTPGLKILCGGEALPRDLADRLLATGSEVWNLYGPTETTIWSTLDRVTSEGRITIGRPIANTDVYILDEQGTPLPTGVSGELYIGGAGLARGYRRRDEETRKRFIYSSRYGGIRLYRTGDTVRRLSDGRIESLGRADHQVKLRGYRIELGEIEAALSRCPEVRQAVAVVREDFEGDPRLIAYVTTRDSVTLDARVLREELRTGLPDYMIPSAFLPIKEFPLTANLKVDRKSLLGPQYAPAVLSGSAGEQTLSPSHVFSQATAEGAGRPLTPVETIIAGIWRDVLNTDQFGLFDDFFAVGGHSLSAAAVVARLRTELEMELPLRSIFLYPTIADLASHISRDPIRSGYLYSSDTPRWECLVPVQPRGSRTPFFFIAGYESPDDTLQVLALLSPFLGEDQPVFGFRPRWTYGGEDYESVEEMAREFLRELRAVQPHGPYLLGGWCVGGIAALELARVLMEEGEQIQLMLLADAERPSAARARAAALYFFHRRLRHIGEVLSTIARADTRKKLHLVRELFRRKMGRMESLEIQEQGRFYRSKMRYRQMLYRHTPASYPGRLTLIVNETQHQFDHDLGWKGFAAGGLDVLTSPGDHKTMFSVYRQHVARTILKCIYQATAAERKEEPAEAVL